MNPHFLPDPTSLRTWLADNHETADFLWVGLYRKSTGQPSLTWPELVDEVLCFGWIDGVRRRVDAERYAIRISPRKPRSTWSNINVARMEALIAEGRVAPAGLAAYERRDPERTGIYSFEREARNLPEALLAELKADAAAWAFWQAQPPGYRRTATAWILSAKREATRRRRLATLVADSAAGQRIGPLRRADGR